MFYDGLEQAFDALDNVSDWAVLDTRESQENLKKALKFLQHASRAMTKAWEEKDPYTPY
jgi:hypothetical protein